MTTTLRSSLAFINIPSDDPARSRAFFEQLFGIDLVPSLWSDESYHAPISADGIDLDINVRHTPQESTTAFLAVADLDGAIRLATRSGGQVLWGPDDLAIPKDGTNPVPEVAEDTNGDSLGRAAVILEPGGSQIGLVELEEHAHEHFAFGKHQQPLTPHQTQAHQRSLEIAQERIGAR
jgi:predicted enzyme related to lactoylglutathione lyase